MDNLVFPTGQS